MSPLADDGRAEGIYPGADGASLQRDVADGDGCIHMERQHCVHPLHRPVLHHAGRAADPLRVAHLLGWLEEKARRAGECLLRQQRRHAQPDGRVSVVSTCVHHAGNLGDVGDVVGLLDGEGIHVRTDGDRGVALPQFCHYPGAAYTGTDPVAQRRQHLRDMGGGACLLEA